MNLSSSDLDAAGGTIVKESLYGIWMMDGWDVGCELGNTDEAAVGTIEGDGVRDDDDVGARESEIEPVRLGDSDGFREEREGRRVG